MSRVRGKIVNSLYRCHTVGGSWARAVDFYCEHKRIGKRSNVYKDLISRCLSLRKLRNLPLRTAPTT